MESARTRAWSITAFLIGLGAGFAILVTFGFVDLWIRGFILGNDFSVLWTGPRMLVTGADPYDPATFRSISLGPEIQRSATAVYIYPGWVAVLAAPLGLLDLRAANVVWTAIGVSAASIGLLVLLESQPRREPVVHMLIGFSLLASQPGIVTLYSGQLTFLIVGGVALMAGLWTSHPSIAGLAGGAMLLKPHLFALGAPALALYALARGERRVLTSLAAVAIGLAALSTIVVPQWWSAWLAHVPTTRAADLRAATLPNALRDMFGAGGLMAAYALLAAAVGAALAFGRSRAALPVWIAVSLSVTPYLWVYDHLVGIVPLAMAASLSAERSGRWAIAVALAGALILTVVATLLHAGPGNASGTLSFNGLAQFALTVLIIASLWRFRKEPAALAPRTP